MVLNFRAPASGSKLDRWGGGTNSGTAKPKVLIHTMLHTHNLKAQHLQLGLGHTLYSTL